MYIDVPILCGRFIDTQEGNKVQILQQDIIKKSV